MAVSSAREAFAVFRRPRTSRDVIRTRRGGARARAAADALDSRLAQRSAIGSLYLVDRGSRICVVVQGVGSDGQGWGTEQCGDLERVVDRASCRPSPSRRKAARRP